MGNSDVVMHAMRMVVPVRHEFGRNIDVRRLMADSDYAREVIALALGSGSERVREQARRLEQMLFPVAAARPAGAPSVPAATVEREVNQRYQLGLR